MATDSAASPQQMRSFVDGPQGRLHIAPQAGGSALPIVFIHEDGGTLHQWDGIRPKIGALLALAFAAADPERVAGLVLVDPIATARGSEHGEQAQEWLARLRRGEREPLLESFYRPLAGADPLVVERVLADAGATAAETLAGTLEARLGFDLRAALARCAAPLLLIRRGDATQSADDLPGGSIRATSVTGAGHWIQLNAPDEFVARLRDFLHDPL